jgi:DNA helicase-2/ATP-dependent DNA helicase PcrA
MAHYQKDKNEEDRLENLRELINAAATFINEYEGEDTGGDSSMLAAFLTHASLEAGEHQAIAGTEALQLMTVHAAKGLEFHSVFLSGLEEGLFPHENAMFESDGLEEERRLMYVAITRARRRLYLSFAQSRMLHGQFRYGIASRFLKEIPAKLLREVNTTFGRNTYETPATSSEMGFGGKPKNVEGTSWRVGQNVAHPLFGSGVIVNCEGRGGDARVQVSFADAGTKWLALEYAKLSAA